MDITFQSINYKKWQSKKEINKIGIKSRYHNNRCEQKDIYPYIYFKLFYSKFLIFVSILYLSYENTNKITLEMDWFFK